MGLLMYYLLFFFFTALEILLKYGGASTSCRMRILNILRKKTFNQFRKREKLGQTHLTSTKFQKNNISGDKRISKTTENLKNGTLFKANFYINFQFFFKIPLLDLSLFSFIIITFF